MNAEQPDSTILIVDDNATNLGVLSGYLRGHGFQLMVARNGADGIERAKMGHPDLILLDVMMPDMDGFETCRRLKAESATAEIPVIFITALQGVEDKVKGFTAGGVDYITKPLQEEEVLARVRTHVQLQQQKNELRREIAERKQIEAQLRRSEEYYRNLVDILPDGLSVVDLEGRVTFLSPRSYTLRGFPPETDMTGTSIFDSFEPSEHARLRERIGQIAANQTFPSTEYRAYRYDGSLMWLQLTSTPLTDAQGVITGIMTLSSDTTVRRAAEDKIHQQNKFLNQVIDSLSHPFYVINVQDYSIAIANSAARTPGTEGLKTCYALTHHRDAPCSGSPHPCPLDIMKQTKQPVHLEHEHTDRDGRSRHVEVHGFPLFDRDGELTQMIEYSFDISKRKQDEAALQESEARFRGMFERHSAIMYLLDPDTGRIMNANQATAQFYGYPLTELRQMNITQINQLTPGDVKRAMQETKAEHRTVSEFQHRLADGRVRDVEVHSTPIRFEGQTVLFSIVHDISERKQAEDALAEERTLLRTMIDNLPDYIYVKNSDRRFVLANTATLRALNCSSLEELLGKSDFDLFPKELAERFSADERTLLTSGVAIINQEEHSIVPETGKQIWLSTTKVPLHDRQGVMIGLVGLTQDISRRKQEEIDLEDAKRRAEEANAAKSVFLANMSHELRTPLNGILGYAQILQRDASLTPTQQQGVDIIERSGRNLLTLINDILDLSKVEAGKIELVPEDFLLPAQLEETGALMRVRAERKGLALRIDLPDDLPRCVHGDAARLRQVLLNLLGNAVKFTEQGSVSLCVETHGRGSPMFDDKGETRNRVSLRFEITDTGIGIAPEELETIFEPFQQVGSKASQQQGTGLGLAITRNLIRLMGGELKVSSVVGQGSTFCFQLTLALVQGAIDTVTSPKRTIVGIDGTPLTILVVDDRADNCTMFVDLLTPLGFTVYAAQNGEDALRQAHSLHPDAMITDIRMPGMNGLDVIRRIRQTPDLKEMVIVASSASVYHEDRQQSLMAGSQAFLPKPIEVDLLCEYLHRLLGVSWVYREDEAVPVQARAMIVPPSDRLAALTKSSIIGDIAEIQRSLTALEKDDAAFQPFVDALRPLVRNFQLTDIRAFLEGCHAQPEHSTADSPSGDLNSTTDALPLSEMLADLPTELLDDLEQAAIQGDFGTIELVIERIRQEHTRLADALARLADEFDYGTIVIAIHKRTFTL